MIKIFIETDTLPAEQMAFLEAHFQVQVLPRHEIEPDKNLNRNTIKKKAQSFFSQLPPAEAATAFYLLGRNQQWHLLDVGLNYLAIDFDEDHLNYQRRSAGKKEVFFKALGGKTKSVLDLTGGLAIDSVFLARNAYQVETVERHPLVYFLLAQAHKKSSDPLIQKMKFHFSDARKFLTENQDRIKNFDAIYFDPMYPEKGKTALSRQEMQLFKSLVGKDDDAASILTELRKFGTRIVVKRPLQGESLDDKKVHEFLGKTVRYDIY